MIFPSSTGMTLTKLSLVGNNSMIPGQGEFGAVRDIPAGDWKIDNFFYSVQCFFSTIAKAGIFLCATIE
jgi:hypothetical protein